MLEIKLLVNNREEKKTYVQFDQLLVFELCFKNAHLYLFNALTTLINPLSNLYLKVKNSQVPKTRDNLNM